METMNQAKPVRMAIVGCGMIARNGYQPRCLAYPGRIELVGYFDSDRTRAEALAKVHEGRVYDSLEDVLNDPGVEAVLNLAIHAAHYPASLAALKAGKHVYSEKPMALNKQEADELVWAADAAGLKLGCAPSAMLGGVQQNVWKRIRDGEIGQVLSAVGNFGGPLEYWHPNADAFLQVGPFLDVLPYPVTAMTTIMGPVNRVFGYAPVAKPDRVLNQGPRAGTRFRIVAPDHGFAMLEFESGARGFIYHSFTVRSEIPALEIHGTEGGFSIQAHDDGRGIRKFAAKDGWQAEPSPEGAFAGLDWGKGIADFADAIRNDRPVRCSGAQARHVVEIGARIVESHRKGEPVLVETRFPAPEPLGTRPLWA
jgi:predicted dehydrogenase